MTCCLADGRSLFAGGDDRAALAALFHSYMASPDEVALTQLSSLVGRLNGAVARGGALSATDRLLLRLYDQYPGDRGVFAPLLLNYLQLAPGESFFIGANEPHAYLSGDCVECMALSDNVVRAGLTPKFRDVDTLCRMLHYRHGAPDMLTPTPLDDFTSVYRCVVATSFHHVYQTQHLFADRPPMDSCAEFEVEVTTVPAHTTDYQLRSGHYASLLLVAEGEATFTRSGDVLSVRKGSVLFIASDSTVTVSTGECQFQFYAAHVNLGAAV